MIAYKLLRRRKDGSLGSLFINRKQILPINQWLKAKCYPTKGYALRPRWHAVAKPIAPHLSMKNRVWCKVEIKCFAKLRRPESQGSIWLLAKKMRIIKVIESNI